MEKYRVHGETYYLYGGFPCHHVLCGAIGKLFRDAGLQVLIIFYDKQFETKL